MSVTTEVSPLRVSEGARGARLERPIRALDIALALVMLLILVPVLLVAALAVRATSKGPAIFRQRRLGRDGRPFTVLKFRTMRTNADETRHREYIRHLITADEARRADDKQLYKLVVDDRITPVGRLLRKTSVDELPQFWNVLRGEMSIVGPRPVIPYEAAIYPDWYRERFSVKPGITGLWQVSGRNGRTYEEMVALDIEFVRRRSLSLYLGIVLRTVPAIILRKGVA
jgi:lipopolysaccharide/colanic/teichoic acid biosynthesis glycosyltransferase